MSDQVTKILIRKGLNSEKNDIILDQAELGYTTDYKRVFVGDGETNGGFVIGNKYQGSINLTDDLSTLVSAESGDYIYDTNQSTFAVLTGGSPTLKDNYVSTANAFQGTVTSITAGGGIIFNQADTEITTTGTIKINIDESSRTVLSTSADGLLFDYNIFYPVTSVIWTNSLTPPTDPGGILEGSGQTWLASGNVTTSTGATVYAWIRTG